MPDLCVLGQRVQQWEMNPMTEAIMRNIITIHLLGITLTKMYWLLGRKSKLSTSIKLLIYKTTLKPIWTYGIQLWGTFPLPT
jgi:hypothetical protein